MKNPNKTSANFYLNYKNNNTINNQSLNEFYDLLRANKNNYLQNKNYAKSIEVNKEQEIFEIKKKDNNNNISKIVTRKDINKLLITSLHRNKENLNGNIKVKISKGTQNMNSTLNPNSFFINRKNNLLFKNRYMHEESELSVNQYYINFPRVLTRKSLIEPNTGRNKNKSKHIDNDSDTFLLLTKHLKNKQKNMNNNIYNNNKSFINSNLRSKSFIPGYRIPAIGRDNKNNKKLKEIIKPQSAFIKKIRCCHTNKNSNMIIRPTKSVINELTLLLNKPATELIDNLNFDVYNFSNVKKGDLVFQTIKYKTIEKKIINKKQKNPIYKIKENFQKNKNDKKIRKKQDLINKSKSKEKIKHKNSNNNSTNENNSSYNKSNESLMYKSFSEDCSKVLGPKYNDNVHKIEK